jgi:flagellar motor switch protein FliM
VATDDILSQEEIDALIHGVEQGQVGAQDEYRLHDSVAREFNLAAQDRIVRGRMPTLEMINNRFCRSLRISLFNFLHRAVDVSFLGMRLTKFSEHVHSLPLPTSLNMFRMPPLRGNGLLVLDARLVYSLVETYFGGEGNGNIRIEEREFSAVENRVIRLMLEQCFQDMQEAWSPVLAVTFEYLSSEVNPQFANIVSPTELVVVSSFSLDLDGVGGDLHMTVPYSMIEPIRDLLDAGVQSDRDTRDDRWFTSIRAEMEVAEVELHATLLETELRFGELLNIVPGDVVPVELPGTVVLCAEGVPIFRGQFGVSNGTNAIKILERIEPTAPSGERAEGPAAAAISQVKPPSRARGKQLE